MNTALIPFFTDRAITIEKAALSSTFLLAHPAEPHCCHHWKCTPSPTGDERIVAWIWFGLEKIL